MSIISQETWDNMSNKEKDNVIIHYNAVKAINNVEYITIYENMFGKENLQPKPKIRTWRDIIENNPNCNFQEYLDSISEGPGMALGINPICKKMIATYKIAKLIELGYGGMVTEEEYILNNESYIKDGCWGIWVNAHGEIKCTKLEDYRDILMFHTRKQAEEFMSYPENRTLVEQYYMV